MKKKKFGRKYRYKLVLACVFIKTQIEKNERLNHFAQINKVL